MTSYLDNGFDVIKCFAKFEKLIPHSIIIPSFMTIGSQMPELDPGGFFAPPYKIGSQNTPYKLGLICDRIVIPLILISETPWSVEFNLSERRIKLLKTTFS